MAGATGIAAIRAMVVSMGRVDDAIEKAVEIAIEGMEHGGKDAKFAQMSAIKLGQLKAVLLGLQDKADRLDDGRPTEILSGPAFDADRAKRTDRIKALLEQADERTLEASIADREESDPGSTGGDGDRATGVESDAQTDVGDGGV